MLIHLVTDRFSLGGGLEHIYQIVKGMGDTRFGVFGEPGPAVEKFNGLNNVEIHDKGYLPGQVMEQSPDLVHIHHLRPLVSFYKNPLAKYNVPIIYTAHGLHIHKYEFYSTIRARIAFFLRYRLEKHILHKPQKVIAVSREDKQYLEEKYRLKNVTYITNGIDFTAVKAAEGKTKKEIREKLELPAKGFLFVTVARFDYQKGYDILIEAIAIIKEFLEKKQGVFLLIGEGAEYEAMKRLSERRGINPYVRYMGARTGVYEFLRAADVCILPSRWEGLPIVLLEAGLLKVPVIASDTYGNREILKETNGILYRNLDSRELARVILEVLENKYDLSAYAGNLYKEVRTNYHLEKMLLGLREIYPAARAVADRPRRGVSSEKRKKNRKPSFN